MLKKILCLTLMSIIAFPAFATMPLHITYLDKNYKRKQITVQIEPETTVGEVKKLISKKLNETCGAKSKFNESNQLITYSPWAKGRRAAQIAPGNDEDLFELTDDKCKTYTDYKLGKCEFHQALNLWFKNVVTKNLEGFVNRLNTKVP